MNANGRYRIVRSKRKTLALVIMPDATLVVRAPRSASCVRIEDAVRQKLPWIRRKIEEIKKRPKATKKAFVQNEEFLFLGSPRRLEIHDGHRIILKEDTMLFPRLFLPHAKERMIAWYMVAAKPFISARVKEYAARMEVWYASVRIGDAATRWGSCSPEGKLNFNWKLVMAPVEVIDYVVVHELSHLLVKDHSRAFWDEVSRVCPDYRIRKNWLKDKGFLLHI